MKFEISILDFKIYILSIEIDNFKLVDNLSLGVVLVIVSAEKLRLGVKTLNLQVEILNLGLD